MSLYEFDPIIETNLPIIPFKSTIQKKKSCVAKLPWVRIVFRLKWQLAHYQVQDL
jgi:hypothetical protein